MSSGPPQPGHRVVIGLGANIGDPERQLRRAVAALGERLGGLLVSSLYRSAAIGPAQSDFLNAALLASWPARLEELLAVTQDIERRVGRQPGERWGPRHVDLDILWAEAATVSSAELQVPHVELTRRAFALLPLLEVHPEAALPGGGPGYRSFLADVRSQRIERWRGTDWWKEV